MKEVKEPDWSTIVKLDWIDNGYTIAYEHKRLNNWFAENIKGKLLIDREDLVEYYASAETGMLWDRVKDDDDTHKSLLIRSSIQPIEKDSFEKLVRDRHKYESSQDSHKDWDLENSFEERAKALLEKKEES